MKERLMEQIDEHEQSSRHSFRLVVGAAAAALVVVVGATALFVAGNDDDTRTGPTPATEPTATTSATPSPSTTAGPGTTDPTGTTTTAPGSDSGHGASGSGQGATRTACTGTAPAMSQPAQQMEIIDVDGDGRRDTAWLASPGNGAREMGIVTAAGGGDKVTVGSAAPFPLSLLVAEADGEPPVELFVSDNRSVQLWTFVDCELQPVTDADGDPYVFDRGFTGYGTGVGCIDADGDGRRDLVGLNVTGLDEPTVDWSRTIIERDGTVATNGATDTGTFHQPADADRIAQLYDVTCGDLTMADDSVTQPD
jgi:hypothetical protein